MVVDPPSTPSAPSALITGSSRGIGHGIAALLAAQQWSLTLSARNAEQLAVVKADFEQLGATVQVVAADVADPDAAQTLTDAHRAAHGTMNALILASGVGSAAPIENYPMRRFDKQFAVNVRAPFELVSKALPLLRAGAQADPARGGRIVALSSIEGSYPQDGLSAYGASKAALISLVKSINIEEGGHGITASAISPAFVDTDMSAWVAETIPPETMITVSDVVKVVELILTLSPRAVLPHVIINRAGASAYHA